MHSGGFFEETENNNNSQSKSEKGSLIPVTAKIINDAVLISDSIDYRGINLFDVTIVGYLKSYTEGENKVKIKICDHSGIAEVVFFNPNETDMHQGLANFEYTNEKILVRIFGTLKSYKSTKNIQGAKIIEVDSNELTYHKIAVVNDWLYLTKNTDSTQNVIL